MEPGEPVGGRYAPEAAYRMLVDWFVERITSGEIPEGTRLTVPHPSAFPRHVQTQGWRATRRWLEVYGLAEERDGEYFARKAS